MGGLAGKHLRFRPQLFWQEILPEQAAAASLQFHCDMATGRNFARLPTDTEPPSASGTFARSVAVAVANADVEDGETKIVTRALREAATFDGALQHLLSSCYCRMSALQPALVEAARRDHVANVELLLFAGVLSYSLRIESKSFLASSSALLLHPVVCMWFRLFSLPLPL